MSASPDALHAIVQRWIERGWRYGDPAVVDELHAPDFIDHDPGGRSPDNRGFKQGIADLFRAFPDLDTRVEEMIIDAAAGRVAVRWSATGTHRNAYLGARPSLRPVTFKGIEILHIRDGRITERWGEWDGMELLMQLGLWKP